MKNLTLISFLSVLVACDTAGDASPECQMQVAGGRLNTPAGVEPWIALWIAGDESCVSGVAEEVRVSMYDTHPATYFRGDATLVFAEAYNSATACAIYKWPAWEGESSDWSVIVSPPARVSGGDSLPRALGLAPSLVTGFDPDVPAAFWRVAGDLVTYPLSIAVPGCWPARD